MVHVAFERARRSVFQSPKVDAIPSRYVGRNPVHMELDSLTADPDSLPTELILNHPRTSLGKVHLDWTPQPGAYVDLEGKTYAVLERRHRYQLKSGRYRLQKVDLYVQSAQRPEERSWVNHRWIIGDATCKFNADSELIRCAVNPNGPCQSCRFYERRRASSM